MSSIHFYTKLYDEIIKNTPEYYGAIGDGIHDDTIAIQKLFDSGVAIIKLPNKYLITSPIIVNNECRIIGNAMGKDSDKSYIYNSKTDIFTIKSDVKNVHFENVLVKGERANSQCGVNFLGNNHNITFRCSYFCSIINGIKAERLWKVSFYDCEFSNTSYCCKFNQMTVCVSFYTCIFYNSNCALNFQAPSTNIFLSACDFDNCNRCVDALAQLRINMNNCGFEKYTIAVKCFQSSSTVNINNAHFWNANEMAEDFYNNGRINCFGVRFRDDCVVSGNSIHGVLCDNVPKNFIDG